jgi:hypothetical protein
MREMSFKALTGCTKKFDEMKTDRWLKGEAAGA